MGKTKPEVSIIIPAYNQAQFLSEAITSALGQTYRDYEIIVVNDGSTDSTPAIAASYGEQIRYISQENRGLAGARNTGIRAANGNLIGLLDSDDIWLPEYLEKITALAKKNHTAAVFYSRARCMDVEGNDLPQVVGGIKDKPNDLFNILLRSNFIIPSTVTFRRAIVEAAGYFDQTLRSCEDWDLWLRLLPEYKFAGCEETLVRYRIHPKSLSADLSGMHSAKRAVVEKHFGPDTGFPKFWNPEKRQAYAGLYRYFLITSFQRRGEVSHSPIHMAKALLADPSLATDLDFYYELALGDQPPGYRGATAPQKLDENALQLTTLLNQVFSKNGDPDLQAIQKNTLGTAYFALGLLAYNSGALAKSRQYLLLALRNRPGLWKEPGIAGNIIKSFFGNKRLAKLRRQLRSNSNG